MLSAGQNNFLAALCLQDGRMGLATLDPSTGEFAVTELIGDDSQERLPCRSWRCIRPSRSFWSAANARKHLRRSRAERTRRGRHRRPRNSLQTGR